MNDRQTRNTASIALIIGAIFGMAGSFLPSASYRGLAWGLDGVGLVLASALLTVYFFRKGYEGAAAGFFMFAIGEGFILSCSASNLDEDISSFAAGTSL
jgi:FtsH-binding integral membrane protein